MTCHVKYYGFNSHYFRVLDLDFQRKTNFLVRFFSCFNKFFMLKFYLKNLNLSESLLKNEYVNILFILIIAIFLSIAIVFLSYLLVMQQPESEKLSSYECGFEPYELRGSRSSQGGNHDDRQ